jgi:amino acid adenylation domain-containing protein
MMPDAAIEDIYRLSPMQEGLLFHSLDHSADRFYIEQFYCRLHGNIDLELMRRAWNTVAQRHDVLRTLVIWRDIDHPVQAVLRSVNIPLSVEDWRAEPETTIEGRIKSTLVRDREIGIELDKAPLMRITLLLISDRSSILLWTYHHLLLDGWSTVLVLKEVLHFYQSYERGLDLALPVPGRYRDYVEWLYMQPRQSSLEFWHRYLKGYRTPAALASKAGSNANDKLSFRAETAISLTAVATEALRAFATINRLTLNVCVQGMWSYLLATSTGINDVVFGCTVSGRPPDLSKIETTVGLFINALPVRVKIVPDEPAVALLQRLQHQQLESQQHQYLALSKIQSQSELPRGVALFESLLIFENYPTNIFEENYGETVGESSDETSERSRLDDLRVTTTTAIEKVHYPICITATANAVVNISLAFDTSIFSRSFAELLLERLETLLTTLPETGQFPVCQLPVQSIREKMLLADWMSGPQVLPREQFLHKQIETQTDMTPDAIAVAAGNDYLTYAALDRLSNKIANALLSSGAQSEGRIGLRLERSLEMVISILGILKAGLVYVPLDPEIPPERTMHMIEEAQISRVLTANSVTPPLPTAVMQLDVGGLMRSLDVRAAGSRPNVDMHPEQLAYVIYTSGSTGRPKGAMNTHTALTNRILWMNSQYHLLPTDRILQKTPFSFDVSVWEFFLPLIVGARLVVARPGGHLLPEYISREIRRQQITVIHFVPSMLAASIENLAGAPCPSLRLMFCSGEELHPTLILGLGDHLVASIHNLYGPTEAAVDVSHYQCHFSGLVYPIPIGKPISNVRLVVLSDQGRCMPIGTAGELYIGGICLARGYIGMPNLTAERFVPDPTSSTPGSRLYRTGDIARWNERGELEFLGRCDRQVKVRGVRIELGEIEVAFENHPKIDQAAVIAVTGDLPGDTELIAYVVPRKGLSMSSEEPRLHLRKSLPSYMMPTRIIILESLPRTSNGKLDRGSLPQTESTPRSHVSRDPRDSIEASLVEIWQRVLKIENCDIDTNFFDIGGNSIAALTLTSQVSRLFGVTLEPRQVFTSPTIAQMAQLLRREETCTSLTLVPLSSRGTLSPLYCIHPGGGLIHSFMSLARQLGIDQPVYGIQAHGFQRGQQPFSTIEDMARHYIDSLLARNASGPYNLVGLSMGSVVAYEMAQQLLECGKDVGSLVLMDGASVNRRSWVDELSDGHNEIEAWSSWYLTKALVEDLGVSAAEVINLDYSARFDRYLIEGKRVGQIPEDISKSSLRRFLQVFATNDLAMVKYIPKTINIDVVLIHSEDITPTSDPYGWGALVKGDLRSIQIPGRHGHFMHAPGVRILAAALRQILSSKTQLISA